MDFCRISTSLSMQKRLPVMGFMLEIKTFDFIQIAREYHLTTIIVTHDPEEALTISNRVLILEKGGIAQYGSPSEIINHPGSEFVKKFILNQLEIKKNNIYTLFHKEDQEEDLQNSSSKEAPEIKLIFVLIAILFAAFLIIPIVRLLGKSVIGEQGVTTAFYK